MLSYSHFNKKTWSWTYLNKKERYKKMNAVRKGKGRTVAIVLLTLASNAQISSFYSKNDKML